jgi:cobalt-zinc-cadmium efflux system outer membrane protein
MPNASRRCYQTMLMLLATLVAAPVAVRAAPDQPSDGQRSFVLTAQADAVAGPIAPDRFAMVPLPAPEPPPAVGMAIGEFESLGLQNNPTLARAQARVRAAQGNWTQVGLYPNPVAAYVGEEIGNIGRAGQQGGMVGQTFILGGKLRLNRAVASHEIAMARQQLAAQQYRVLTDVRIGFFNVLVAQRRVEVARQLVTIGEEGVRAAEALLRAQEASRADLLQARVELGSTTIVLSNAQNRHAAAWRALVAVVGVPDLAPSTVVGDLTQPASDLDWYEVLERVLAASPELAAAQANVERARCALARAQVQWVPDVDAQAGVRHLNGNGYDAANVVLAIPLPLFDRNQGGIVAAQGQLVAAQRDVERIELNLQQRLAEAFRRYASARDQVSSYQQTILPNAKASLQLVTEGYQKGEFDYVNLLTAQRTYFRNNLAYLESLRSLKIAAAEIEGLLLTGGLQAR